MPTNLKTKENKFLPYLAECINHLSKAVYNSDEYNKYKTEIPPELLRYVKSSRLEKEQPMIGYPYYDVIFLHIGKILEKYKIHVTFLTTYSLNRKNETIEINGRRFIIYDQYLGKTFNLFNKAFIQLKEPKVLDHYCLRYLVEAFRVKGMAIEATIFAEVSFKTKAFDELNKAYSTPSEVNSYTFIQETFIILHEIAHLIVKQNPRLKDFRRKQINDYIDKQPYSLFSKLDDKEKDSIGAFELDENRRENLIEEIVCDFIATKYTFEILFDVELLESDQFAEAIYLGLRTMRSINLINGFITAYTDRVNEKKTFNLSQLFRESSIRFWLIKDSIRTMYKNKKYKSKFKRDPLDMFLENDLSGYDPYYEDPFLHIQTVLKKGGDSIKSNAAYNTISFKQQLDALNDIDKTLGWKK